MPNVDLAVKAEVVNYDRHGFSRPNLWHRPIAKVVFVIMLFHWYSFGRMYNMLTKHDGVYVINRCAYFDQKVYDVNRITGNVLYRPMINYINKKVLLWLCFIHDDQKAFKTGVFKENFRSKLEFLDTFPSPHISSFWVITTHVIFTRRLSRLSPVLRTALQWGRPPPWRGQRKIPKSDLSNLDGIGIRNVLIKLIVAG